jgi:DNA polymerase I-like protein with 3'-5' exonuclease and polymerase domains
MIYTNIKGMKPVPVHQPAYPHKPLPRVEEVTYMDPEDMFAKLSQLNTFFFDIETYAPELTYDDFEAKELAKIWSENPNKRISKTVLAGIKKRYEEARGDICLNPRRGEVRLVQLLTPNRDVFIFDMLEFSITRMAEFLHGKNLAGQNIRFDMSFLLAKLPEFRPKHIFDTMIAYKILKHHKTPAYFNAHLGDVIKATTGIDLVKGHGSDNWGLEITQDMFEYAVYDVLYLDIAVGVLTRELNEISINKNKNGYFNQTLFDKVAVLEMQYVEVLMHISMRGMPISIPKLRHRAWELQHGYNYLAKKFESLGFNPGSPVQVLKYLDSIGVDAMNTTRGELLRFAHLDIVRDLLVLKRIDHELTTIKDYTEVHVEPDGCIHSNFNQIRAASGRQSSSDPNSQQIPKGSKKIFYDPGPGYSILQADYPNIEMRIMGVISKDPMLINSFKHGLDLHRIMAAKIAGIPESEVTPSQRRNAKPANFGFIYGMGPVKFVDYAYEQFGTTYTVEEATEIRNIFMGLYTKVKALHDWNSARLRDRPEILVSTLLGRQIMVDRFTNANNYPVQGSCADMLKLASVLIFNKSRELGLDLQIINTIHDELTFISRTKDNESNMKIISELMQTSVDYMICDFATPIEVEVLVEQ